MSLILLFLFILIALPIEAAPSKAKRIISGEEVTQYETWLKTKDGTEYGPGSNGQNDTSKLMWLIIAQMVVFAFSQVGRAIEWWRGDKENLRKDIAEMKAASLTAAHNIAYLKEHSMTEAKVSAKVREEIKHLREYGFFEPGRRSGSRDG